MKKVIVILAAQFVSGLAFAGGGTVSCNLDGSIVAMYSWFDSNADSYSTVKVFVEDLKGNFKQLDAESEEALEPLSVISTDGTKITVSADLGNDRCEIRIK